MNDDSDANNVVLNDSLQKEKESILAQLKEVPIVQFACKKANVGRASYYRWRKEDTTFAALADKAIEDGIQFTNELTELQLINLTRDRKMSAIAFWLRHNHPRYKQKLEIELNATSQETLSPEQEEVVKKALRISSFGNLSYHDQQDKTEDSRKSHKG